MLENKSRTAAPSPFPPPPEGRGFHGDLSVSEEMHTRVEFDTAFHGGDYDKVGRFALIPHSAIEAHGGSVERAFKAATGIEPRHMIHFAPDDVYDAAGKWVEAEAPDEGGRWA